MEFSKEDCEFFSKILALAAAIGSLILVMEFNPVYDEYGRIARIWFSAFLQWASVPIFLDITSSIIALIGEKTSEPPANYWPTVFFGIAAALLFVASLLLRLALAPIFPPPLVLPLLNREAVELGAQLLFWISSLFAVAGYYLVRKRKAVTGQSAPSKIS